MKKYLVFLIILIAILAAACTQQKPVCGFMGDGSSETYSNMCNACKNSEVAYFQEGEC